MSINLNVPEQSDTQQLKPKLTVIGVGGAGGNAVNNMINSELEGVDFVVANTDAQALAQSKTERRIQLGASITQGLGAGSRPEVGRAAAEEAIEGAQILTTCTADKQNATILTDNMVGAGVHINAIGGDCPGKTELHRDIVARAEMFVEYPEQTRIEGELQQMPEDHPFTELWQVVSGSAPGRRDAQQVTLFDSVGFAIEDFSALRFVRDRIRGTEYYTDLDLLADPDDPRDLFGMLMRSV